MLSLDLNTFDPSSLPFSGVAQASTPANAAIQSIYPNPVNVSRAQSTVKFSVADDAHATMAVYDVLGREERVLLNEWSVKGDHQAVVDLSGLPAGQHYIVLTAAGTSITRPITVE
jgi:hypothetical protein